ncbi:MAG TPA: hypothetical protein VK806_02345 [Bacteroidia bacterium]|jgi:hypothetical protein|nr:hypothetical protein [Bacteroidia bacterium]
MKKNLLLSFLFLCIIRGYGQSILVIVNADCKVYVDGDEKGKVKADNALKVSVTKGDHYIQAKGKWNGQEKSISKTITVSDDKQIMLNLTFGDEQEATTSKSDTASIIVAEVGVKMPGTMEVGTWINNNPNKEFPNNPTYFYGFEKGDIMVIDYSAVSNSTNSLDISTCPVNIIKYSNKSFTELHNIRIKVEERGVYRFVMSTKHFGTATGTLSIKRIPANAVSKNFNTGVVWKDVNDTTYREVEERYLVKSDTTIIDLSSPTIEVHSKLNSSGNHEYFRFTLPKNTISWGYYIGVDQSGEQAFQDALDNLTKAALPVLTKFPTAGPIGAFILSGVNYVAKLQSGESVSYTLVQGDQNRNLFLSNQGGYQEYKSGDVINDLEKMSTNISSPAYFCFRNNNKVTAIHITLRITAITVNQQWETKPVKKMSIVTKHLPRNIN